MKGKYSPSFKQRKDTIHSIGHDELQNVQAHASRPRLVISDKDTPLTLWKTGLSCRSENFVRFRSVTEKAHGRREPRVQVMRLVKGRHC